MGLDVTLLHLLVSTGLDFYCCVKLINYIRSEVGNDSVLTTVDVTIRLTLNMPCVYVYIYWILCTFFIKKHYTLSTISFFDQKYWHLNQIV